MEIKPPLFPLVLGKTTLATTPFPIIITMAVPSISAKNGVIFFLFFCNLFVAVKN
jgi:hypothetical protein